MGPTGGREGHITVGVGPGGRTVPMHSCLHLRVQQVRGHFLIGPYLRGGGRQETIAYHVDRGDGTDHLGGGGGGVGPPWAPR